MFQALEFRRAAGGARPFRGPPRAAAFCPPRVQRATQNSKRIQVRWKLGQIPSEKTCGAVPPSLWTDRLKKRGPGRDSAPLGSVPLLDDKRLVRRLTTIPLLPHRPRGREPLRGPLRKDEPGHPHHQGLQGQSSFLVPSAQISLRCRPRMWHARHYPRARPAECPLTGSCRLRSGP